MKKTCFAILMLAGLSVSIPVLAQQNPPTPPTTLRAVLLEQFRTHTAYHTGQILYVRKLQGVWDSDKGVK
jgi:hypothetical protein